MPSVKQGGIKYHFSSLWYDSTWDWTPVSWTTGGPYNKKDKVISPNILSNNNYQSSSQNFSQVLKNNR